MTVWLSADLHVDHHNILAYCNRPFTSVSHMQEELVRRFNERVAPKDELWILGDFSMGEKIVPIILPKFNGTKYLVSGNHCQTHPSRKNHEAAKLRYLHYGFAGVFHEVHNFHGFLLNHMPYVEEGAHGAKYAQWRPKDEGKWLLCGHVHQSFKIDIPRRTINVGCDVWDYYPVPLATLTAIRDGQLGSNTTPV